MIRDNADGVMSIQRDAFLRKTNDDGSNPLVDCDNLPFVDLNAFKEGNSLFDIYELTLCKNGCPCFVFLGEVTKEFD